MPTLNLPDWLRNAYYLGNTPYAYLSAALAFAAALLLLKIVRETALGKLKALAQRTATDLDDLALRLLNAITPLEYTLLAFYAATRYLERVHTFDTVLNTAMLLVFSCRAAIILHGLAAWWLEKAVTSREISQDAKDSVLSGAGVIVKALIWVAAALFVLDNLGINITTVLAGLGIGGVAVALAAQAILGDLFNFFVILLDKPFRSGDFIVFEGIEGTVENVGLKSTLIRSLSGEAVIISNSKLLSAGLRNYNQMTRRRAAFKLSVTLQTPAEKLRRVPGLVKAAVAKAGGTFDRATLAAAGDYAFEYEAVYFVENPDYAVFAAMREQVLLAIAESFRAEGIELACPARTVHLSGSKP